MSKRGSYLGGHSRVFGNPVSAYSSGNPFSLLAIKAMKGQKVKPKSKGKKKGRSAAQRYAERLAADRAKLNARPKT